MAGGTGRPVEGEPEGSASPNTFDQNLSYRDPGLQGLVDEMNGLDLDMQALRVKMHGLSAKKELLEKELYEKTYHFCIRYALNVELPVLPKGTAVVRLKGYRDSEGVVHECEVSGYFIEFETDAIEEYKKALSKIENYFSSSTIFEPSDESLSNPIKSIKELKIEECWIRKGLEGPNLAEDKVEQPEL